MVLVKRCLNEVCEISNCDRMISATKPTIIVTRPEGRGFAEQCVARGYHVIELPLFKLQPIAMAREHVAELLARNAFDWILITSRFGAELSAPIVRQLEIACSVATIGKETASVWSQRFGKQPDFIGGGGSSESFGHELLHHLPRTARVLHLTGADHRGVLKPLLETSGRTCEVAAIYQQERHRVSDEQINAIKQIPSNQIIWTFFSPSAVNAAMAINQHVGSRILSDQVVVLGETTHNAALAYGMLNIARAHAPSADGVLQAIGAIIK
jgi:uroporphyrinogen-III synthase